MRRYHLGQRVTVTAGRFAGARGRISQRAHADARPVLEWIVRFDADSVGAYVGAGGGTHTEGAVSENELAAYTVPESARPVIVGALKRGAR